ncbi:MAG: DUF1573 domain-containing protein [Bacteroidales bacterium]|nr:DUF1573 domain-containing protein [Bacteroidales bacterium]
MMMMRRYISLALLLCAATMAMAQGVPSWMETTHDFGTFRDSLKTVTTEMKVVNTGDSALMITRVQTNCGCTVAEYTRDAIQPGDTGCVTVTYSARNIPGPFEKKVYVYTTGKPRKSTLTVKGSVIGSPATVAERYPFGFGPIRLNSASMPLGEILKGKSRTAYISGYNTASDTMLLSAKIDSKYISCNVLPDTVPPGGIFIASVYCSAAGAPQWGFNTDSVRLTARGMHSGEVHSGQFNVMLQVKEDFSRLTDKQRRNAPVIAVSTDKVDFETLAPNEPVQRTFTITNRGNDVLRLRRLFIPEGEGLSASADRYELKKGQSATVTVTLDTPARHDSVVNSRLTIIANDPYTPQTIVRLVGIVM